MEPKELVEESYLEKPKYLKCVVKELMHLHSVIPLLIHHESMEDCEVEGFPIPNKSRVIMNVRTIGSDLNFGMSPNPIHPRGSLVVILTLGAATSSSYILVLEDRLALGCN